MNRKYAVIFEQAETNWAAYVPDLPGCVTTGRTLEETERNIREAIPGQKIVDRPGLAVCLELPLTCATISRPRITASAGNSGCARRSSRLGRHSTRRSLLTGGRDPPAMVRARPGWRRNSRSQPLCGTSHATEYRPKLMSAITAEPLGIRSRIGLVSACSLTACWPYIGPQQGRATNPLDA